MGRDVHDSTAQTLIYALGRCADSARSLRLVLSNNIIRECNKNFLPLWMRLQEWPWLSPNPSELITCHSFFTVMVMRFKVNAKLSWQALALISCPLEWNVFLNFRVVLLKQQSIPNSVWYNSIANAYIIWAYKKLYLHLSDYKTRILNLVVFPRPTSLLLQMKRLWGISISLLILINEDKQIVCGHYYSKMLSARCH